MLATLARQLRVGLLRDPPACRLLLSTPSYSPSPLLTQCHNLRTAGCRGGAAVREQLAPHQTIIEDDNKRDTALLHNINQQIVGQNTGRLFTVVFLRGKQHKVTSGMW